MPESVVFGSLKDKPLRFKVAVAKISDFKSAYTTKRGLAQTAKLKNLSDADVSKWRARTMQDHDVVLGSSAEDIKMVSAAMASQAADASQSFAGELATRFSGDRLKEWVPETMGEDCSVGESHVCTVLSSPSHN